MSGMMIVAAGIGLLVFSVILCVASIIYRRTTGRRIKEEIMRDYE